MKYDKSISKKELAEYSRYSLKDKIRLSREIIKDFYENIEDKNSMIISSSFGKDSVVLIDLVRSVYPEIPIVYMNTGVEHPSCIELSKTYDNVLEVSPKKTMEEIIEEYGYMLPIGKEKTNTISLCRKNLGEGKFNTVRVKKMRGDFGEKSLFNFTKYQWVVFAPFKISDKCCQYLKIEPSERIGKKYGYTHVFVGITAEESRMRKNNLLNNGFNTETQSRPLGHWTVHDILQYCLNQDIQIASCYGDIIKGDDGKLKTSKFSRTGCVCCPIGSHLKNKNDFQRLYEEDREIWDYVINKLGFGQVLDFFDVPYVPIKENSDSEVQSKLI